MAWPDEIRVKFLMGDPGSRGILLGKPFIFKYLKLIYGIRATAPGASRGRLTAGVGWLDSASARPPAPASSHAPDSTPVFPLGARVLFESGTGATR
jgi:hypothetical protein